MSHVHLDPSSNLHPYECDGPGRCPHCDRVVSDEHDPVTCVLCDDISEPDTTLDER